MYFQKLINELKNGTPEEFYKNILSQKSCRFNMHHLPCFKDNMSRCAEFIVSRKEYFDRLNQNDVNLDAILFIIMDISSATGKRIVDVEKFVSVAVEKYFQYLDYFTHNIDAEMLYPTAGAVRKTVEFFVEIIKGK